MQITAIILAGGLGTRMGGADKGLVSYQEKCMVEHVLTRIEPQVDQVILNANRNLQRYQSFGFPVITDASPHFDGPLAGMLAGMHQAQTEWVISIPCDAPLLPLDLVDRLSQAVKQEKCLMAIATSPSGNHPVFCLMHRSLSTSLAIFLNSGQRKVSAWQTQQPHTYAPFEEEQAFTNINTIEASPMVTNISYSPKRSI